MKPEKHLERSLLHSIIMCYYNYDYTVELKFNYFEVVGLA